MYTRKFNMVNYSIYYLGSVCKHENIIEVVKKSKLIDSNQTIVEGLQESATNIESMDYISWVFIEKRLLA